jgi:pimeloyl-ACP methyl ester carboxylesterase
MTFTKSELKLPSGTLTCHVGGTGRPVLYLHSAGGVRISSALETLAKSFRLYMPVMPGFDGTPENPKLRSMADLANVAAEVIDAEILKGGDRGRCDVVGHSFGGWTAAWLAALHPAKVGQLVLHAAAGFRPEGVGGLVADPVKLRQMMFAHPENLPPEQKTPELLAKNRTMVHHYHGATAMDRDLLAKLGSIEAMTLILHGTKDGVIPLDSPRLLKEKIPRAFLMYVYDAAHAIDVDQPARFVNLVKDFFERGEAFIVNWKTGAVAA